MIKNGLSSTFENLIMSHDPRQTMGPLFRKHQAKPPPLPAVRPPGAEISLRTYLKSRPMSESSLCLMGGA